MKPPKTSVGGRRRRSEQSDMTMLQSRGVLSTKQSITHQRKTTTAHPASEFAFSDSNLTGAVSPSYRFRKNTTTFTGERFARATWTSNPMRSNPR